VTTRARPIDLARVFKALGDPSRLAIYEIVRQVGDPDEGHSASEIDNSISQIASRFDLSLSTVSHHIKELRNAGLIRCERRGQSIYCSADPDVLEQVRAFLEPPPAG
jgi:DNA-binding transcriptional ArsR family regulator